MPHLLTANSHSVQLTSYTCSAYPAPAKKLALKFRVTTTILFDTINSSLPDS